MSPRQIGGWLATLLAWGVVISQPQDTAGAGLGRSLAITLTLVSVMVACYEGLLRGQQKMADRVEARMGAAIADLTEAVVVQEHQIRRVRKRLTTAIATREAHAQECSDELGAQIRHLTDVIRANALLDEVRPKGPTTPAPVRLLPLQPHGT
jgi:hypothetical protein